MKVFLNENQSEGNIEWCFKNYGKELFSKTFGGNEPNTDKEDKDQKNIRNFTNHDYGLKITNDVTSTIKDLNKCVKVYSKVLEPKEELIYRGTSIKFKDFNNLFKDDISKNVDYVYKAKSPIQSWTNDYNSSHAFFDGTTTKSIINLIMKLEPLLEKEPNDDIRNSILKMLPSNYNELLVPVVLTTKSTPENDFLFKPAYLRRLSSFQHEYELIRIDNKPLKCTLHFNHYWGYGDKVILLFQRFINYINNSDLNESSITLPNIRIPNEDTYGDYKSVSYNQIELIELGDDGGNIVNLGVKFPNEDEVNDGVAFDIQMINDELYHPHMHIAKKLQGQGIGFKVLLKFIHEFGHMYVTEARTLNKEEIPKIMSKLKTDSSIETYKTKSGGILFILKTNPYKDHLISKYVN